MALAHTPTKETESQPPLLVLLPPPTYTFDMGNIITVVVGEAQTKMAIHNDYIPKDSDSFKAVRDGAWIKSEAKIINLPAEDPKEMAYYFDLVYARKLPTTVYHGISLFGSSQLVLPTSYIETLLMLSRLYVLGERILDEPFRNALLYEMTRVIAFDTSSATRPTGPPPEVVNTIYQGTTANSPARHLLVDWTLHMVTTASTECNTRRSSSSTLRQHPSIKFCSECLTTNTVAFHCALGTMLSEFCG
jgi:hypothetical protein